jgi:putative tricarboxylic transport membrane protein
MKKDDFISSPIWMIVSILFGVRSIGLGLGSINDPGPGFFPFLMATLLFLFSLTLIISSLKKDEKFESKEMGRFWAGSEGIRNISFVIMALFIYVFALNYLGFVLVTFFFMIFVMRIIQPQKWLIVFLASGLTTVLSYAIFVLWLKIHMPVGILGF